MYRFEEKNVAIIIFTFYVLGKERFMSLGGWTCGLVVELVRPTQYLHQGISDCEGNKFRQPFKVFLHNLIQLNFV